MIRVKSTESVPLLFDVAVQGPAIYLDNFALIELSKDRPINRRGRFLAALEACRGSLLFSGTNAVEGSLSMGISSSRLRAFLNQFGPRWAFIESNPFKVMEREANGADHTPCLSIDRMHAFFQDRKSEVATTGGLIDLSATAFFQLGAVLDWLKPQRAILMSRAVELDEAVVKLVRKTRLEYDADPRSLDLRFPSIPFDGLRPTTFVWTHLIRNLVKNAKSHPLKEGDGRDLCHAAVGAAYGSAVALDKHWKKRIQELPLPNKLARVYYAPELDMLVDDLESDAGVIYPPATNSS
jgi:hypothetical protein